MAEPFSLPLAPPESTTVAEHPTSEKPVKQQPLRNEDFRKLLQTPRAAGSTPASSQFEPGSTQNNNNKKPIKKEQKAGASGKRNKSHYKQKREGEEDDLNALLKKYRDRAAERREGENKTTESEMELMKLQAGYRAVAPDERTATTAAERRKQMIQESKYLGGDIEHTHLVKGLDYSLLQKVRSEITAKEQEEDELETAYQTRKAERDETEAHIKAALARNIYRVLFKDDLSKCNELFAPRRMAYVIDLDEDFGESDIPTTLVRSKQDCPVDEASTNLSTNDMVIQKMTQVLSYLRTDTKRKKKEKIEKAEFKPTAESAKVAGQNIYDDAAEYVPKREKDRDRNRDEKPSSSSRTYFDDSRRDRDRNRDDRDRDRRRDRDSDRRGSGRTDTTSRRQRDNVKTETDDRLAKGWAPADISREREQRSEAAPANGRPDEKKKTGIKAKMESTEYDDYMECYPGGAPEFDAGDDDSDDDADYSKMDLGNKKGPIRRWDFENEEQYEKYMTQREALPKAAYQYGIKMSDGRKTRKTGGLKTEKDERQKIDKQWNQISKILQKRKDGGGVGESAKKAKY